MSQPVTEPMPNPCKATTAPAVFPSCPVCIHRLACRQALIPKAESTSSSTRHTWQRGADLQRKGITAQIFAWHRPQPKFTLGLKILSIKSTCIQPGLVHGCIHQACPHLPSQANGQRPLTSQNSLKSTGLLPRGLQHAPHPSLTLSVELSYHTFYSHTFACPLLMGGLASSGQQCPPPWRLQTPKRVNHPRTAVRSR